MHYNFQSEDELNFLDFIHKCFEFDPEKRMTPKDALLHKWIVDGLPDKIRDQHINFLN
jgi:serine/threonine protein kinase